MPRKKIGKVKNNTKPRNNVKESIRPISNGQEGIIVDFSCPLSFYSCQIKNEFTNYLKEPLDFVESRRVLFGEALEYFSKNNFDELASNAKKSHTHIVAPDKLELLEKILVQLAKKKGLGQNIDRMVSNFMEGDIWQLAYKQGLRLIGGRNDNIFNLLFIDYHHLIEPSSKYNNKDYYKYTYCPMSSDYCSNCDNKST